MAANHSSAKPGIFAPVTSVPLEDEYRLKSFPHHNVVYRGDIAFSWPRSKGRLEVVAPRTAIWATLKPTLYSFLRGVHSCGAIRILQGWECIQGEGGEYMHLNGRLGASYTRRQLANVYRRTNSAAAVLYSSRGRVLELWLKRHFPVLAIGEFPAFMSPWWRIIEYLGPAPSPSPNLMYAVFIQCTGFVLCVPFLFHSVSPTLPPSLYIGFADVVLSDSVIISVVFAKIKWILTPGTWVTAD